MTFIDMDSYPRRRHFDYFRSLQYPYMGLTAQVDITALAKRLKADGRSLFLGLLYCVSRAANSVPELRQRIVGEAVAQFELCPTSHTVALPDGTYCYCELRADMPFEEFYPYARERQEAAKAAASLDEGDSTPLFFITSLPWLEYTALTQPVPFPADSNPRISWGRAAEHDGKILLPMTILCNHALVDGVHIARFFEALNELIESF